jgi:Xaa-Pro aminopeptidase
MITITTNLVDSVWGDSKPAMPQATVFVHEIKYSGLSVQEKFTKVTEKLGKKVDALLITTLDDIDWIVNMRGNDIKYNPVFFSYAIFFPSNGEEGSKSTLRLYITNTKVASEEVQAHIKENAIETYDYYEITDHLR